MENKEILKISSKGDTNKIASMIAHCIQDGKKVELQAIGAGAVNQAVKAIATARGFVATTSGISLLCIPTFTEVEIEGATRTAIKLIIIKEV